MEKKVLNSKINNDIKSAEKFFNRTGEDIKDIYILENPDIEKINENGIKNIFLYIPEANDDIYAIFLN
jgi:flagellar capping protein FliD